MSDHLEGCCHCGAVRVQVPSAAFGVVACHCGDCQKLHGNFFAMLAVDRPDFGWVGTSEEHVRWYDSSDKARRSFCNRCGSRLTKEPNGAPKTLVSIGLFDRTVQRKIEKNVFDDQKPAWYESSSPSLDRDP